MIRPPRVRRRVLRTQSPASVVCTDAAYEFVPPHQGRIWPRVLNLLLPHFLRGRYGVTRVELRGEDTLRQLQQAGHSILLTPNHCRMADPVVLLQMAKQLRQSLYLMASSHLFHGHRVMSFTMRRVGAFSVYREGVDRKAVQTAIDLLAQGDRPLVIFPEGALSQANDHLNALMEGVALIGRSAHRRIQEQAESGAAARRTVMLPVAIKYLYQGDIHKTVAPILGEIEQHLLWGVQHDRPLVERVLRVGSALLSLKEIEYLGGPQSGSLEERQQRLIDGVLAPIEQEWLSGAPADSVVKRVRFLRREIVPEMIEGGLAAAERERRWKQLTDLDLAQAISLFPPHYVASRPTVDRILETVERFDENLRGKDRAHPPLHAVLQIGSPVEVEGRRPRNGTGDPLIKQVAGQLKTMLADLSLESKLYEADKVNQHASEKRSSG